LFGRAKVGRQREEEKERRNMEQGAAASRGGKPAARAEIPRAVLQDGSSLEPIKYGRHGTDSAAPLLSFRAFKLLSRVE
jgi:hypothetical protein